MIEIITLLYSGLVALLVGLVIVKWNKRKKIKLKYHKGGKDSE